MSREVEECAVAKIDGETLRTEANISQLHIYIRIYIHIYIYICISRSFANPDAHLCVCTRGV